MTIARVCVMISVGDDGVATGTIAAIPAHRVAGVSYHRAMIEWLGSHHLALFGGGGVSVDSCGRCGSLVVAGNKDLHEDFHARLIEDPRFPYETEPT